MRAMFWVAVVSILIGAVLALTGFKPGIGYGPPPKDEVCHFDSGGHLKCKERDR